LPALVAVKIERRLALRIAGCQRNRWRRGLAGSHQLLGRVLLSALA
jgi:hypothetical protein